MQVRGFKQPQPKTDGKSLSFKSEYKNRSSSEATIPLKGNFDEKGNTYFWANADSRDAAFNWHTLLSRYKNRTVMLPDSVVTIE